MIRHDLAVRNLDLARHGLRQVLIVGDDDHRLATGNELVKKVKDAVRRLLVQVTGRLVGDDQRRVVGQRRARWRRAAVGRR